MTLQGRPHIQSPCTEQKAHVTSNAPRLLPVTRATTLWKMAPSRAGTMPVIRVNDQHSPQGRALSYMQGPFPANMTRTTHHCLFLANMTHTSWHCPSIYFFLERNTLYDRGAYRAAVGQRPRGPLSCAARKVPTAPETTPCTGPTWQHQSPTHCPAT